MGDNLEHPERAVEWEPPITFWSVVVLGIFFMISGMYHTFMWAFNALGW